MKIPAELMDWDRRPMPSPKRLPSPYTNVEPPRPIRRESDTAMVAFCCFAMVSGMLMVLGAAQLIRWIWEAVR